MLFGKKSKTINDIPNDIPKRKIVFDGMILDDEQVSAFDEINNSNGNFFITGKAGTGKSLLLQYFITKTDKNVVVLAPTGIAAINIHGQTIHSFFGLKPQIQNVSENSQTFVNNQQRTLYKSIDTLVIDEISMVRCDVMDMIDAKLKAARNSKLPFGGCQVIVFGDLYQLPPVVGKDENEIKYIFDSYGSEFFFAAPAVQDNPFKIIELSTIHRQNDLEYVNHLNKIRTGTNDSATISYFNQRLIKPKSREGIITLTTKRIAAEIVNRERLNKIDSKEFIYHGAIDGEFLDDDLPTDLELHLKVGAQIMMVKNDRNKRWVNGSIGHISKLEKNAIYVSISGTTFSVDKESWTKHRYIFNEEHQKLERTPIGTFTQFPIKLAYAITIHKSQGRTYDKAIIDYSEGHAFAAGQTYVALSRCKSFDGLYLDEPIIPEDIITRQDIVSYLDGTFHTDVKRLPFVEKDSLDSPKIEWLDGNQIKVTKNKKPKKITGTRLASVLNLDRYKTPFETWCALTHTYEKPFEENQFTNAGKTIEAKQIEYIKKQINSDTHKVVFPDDEYGKNAKENKGYDFFGSTDVFGGMWDSIIKDEGENAAVFEMKTTSAKKKQEWLTSPPKSYLLQAALYSWLMGLNDFYIVVSFIEGREYYNPDQYICTSDNTVIKYYKISETFPDFEDKYIRPALKWWNDYVETGVSPKFDLEKDKEILEKLKKASVSK